MPKNITLSADEKLLESARRKAAAQHVSLNELFRQWLRRFVGHEGGASSYRELMDRLSHTDSGGSFSRDELNERR